MPYVDFDYLDRMRFNLNSHIQGKTYAWVNHCEPAAPCGQSGHI